MPHNASFCDPVIQGKYQPSSLQVQPFGYKPWSFGDNSGNNKTEIQMSDMFSCSHLGCRLLWKHPPALVRKLMISEGDMLKSSGHCTCFGSVVSFFLAIPLHNPSSFWPCCTQPFSRCLPPALVMVAACANWRGWGRAVCLGRGMEDYHGYRSEISVLCVVDNM